METKEKKPIDARKVLWTAVLLVVATLLSAAKVIELPEQGGSATYFSLLVLWLISYIFGVKHGLIFSVVFGVIRIFVNAVTGEAVAAERTLQQILTEPFDWKVWLAIVLEYPLAYGVFCVGAFLKLPGHTGDSGDKYTGAWRAEAWELRCGYLLGVLGQFALYVISAMCFYEWPQGEGFGGSLVYNMKYDGYYLLTEVALTMLLLCVPPVVEAIDYLKYMATYDEDELLDYF